MFLGTNKTSARVFRTLSNARRLTDEFTVGLNSWSPLYIPERQVALATRDDFRSYINEYRVEVAVTAITVEYNVKFYTEINMAFLNDMAKTITFPGQDKLLVAFNSLLRAADAAGIQRALGATFFLSCSFSKSTTAWFYELEAATSSFMQELFKYHEESKATHYTQLAQLYPLEDVLKNTIANMLDKSYKPECLN